MRSLRKRIIAYLLGIFTLPKVKEQVARYARAFMGEASRYSSGFRGEALETRDAFVILAKYIKREKITRLEKKQFQHQVVDLLKGTGVVVPVMLIPLPFISTLLLIIMDHLLLSMNIKILPSAFYPENKPGLLTPEGVEEDLAVVEVSEKKISQ
ncbi:MAG: LETM1 domain-containing protein [Bacteroidetes bacterium]|nr:LETM1 domain-containing protein [Bacteroidota bacterium]